MKIVIVYGELSKIVRRIHIPDSDTEIPSILANLATGETSLVMERPDGFHSTHAQQHVADHHGMALQDIRSAQCHVINEAGEIVTRIMADPLIDTHPIGQIVHADALDC